MIVHKINGTPVPHEVKYEMVREGYLRTVVGIVCMAFVVGAIFSYLLVKPQYSEKLLKMQINLSTCQLDSYSCPRASFPPDVNYCSIENYE